MATLLSDRLALDIPRVALLFLRAFGCFSRAARGSALSVSGARFAVAVCLATGTMLHCTDAPCNYSHLYFCICNTRKLLVYRVAPELRLALRRSQSHNGARNVTISLENGLF